MSNFWRCLEGLPGLLAVPARWRSRLGGEYEAIRGAFLRVRPNEPARYVPCPVECGCSHEVVRHDDGRIVGICRCEEWNCDDLPLKEEEVVLLELNWSRLGRAISTAFECEPKEAALGMRGLVQVGSFGAAALPVVLSIQHEREFFHAALNELIVRLREGFVLLSPTGRFYDVRAQELLGNARAGFFDLESNLTVLASGALTARTRGGELFTRFLPRKETELGESEAAKLLVLMKQLEAEPKQRKAPLYTVFRMLVLDGLSQRAVADRCGCVESLISARVLVLERRFRLSIAHLRNYASDLLSMEAAAKGQRTRKKKSGRPDDFEPAEGAEAGRDENEAQGDQQWDYVTQQETQQEKDD